MGMLLRRHYPQKPVETEVVNETEVVTYNDLTVKELRDIAKEREIEGYSTLSKEELIAVLEGQHGKYHSSKNIARD